MNLWCKDTTVCAINSTFSVDFYTFYWANVCTVCPVRLQFILKMFHCMTTPGGIIDILETNLRIEALRFRIAFITKQTYSRKSQLSCARDSSLQQFRRNTFSTVLIRDCQTIQIELTFLSFKIHSRIVYSKATIAASIKRLRNLLTSAPSYATKMPTRMPSVDIATNVFL